MRTRTRQQALYALADYICRPNKERRRGDTAAAMIEIQELLEQVVLDAVQCDTARQLMASPSPPGLGEAMERAERAHDRIEAILVRLKRLEPDIGGPVIQVSVCKQCRQLWSVKVPNPLPPGAIGIKVDEREPHGLECSAAAQLQAGLS